MPAEAENITLAALAERFEIGTDEALEVIGTVDPDDAYPREAMLATFKAAGYRDAKSPPAPGTWRCQL